MKSTMTLAFTGGCACGAVRYECTAPPLRMVNCHCRDCQKASGSGYSATVIVATSGLRRLRGECNQYQVAAESGNLATREFCGACGTPLFASNTGRPDVVGVKAASLDDPSWFVPEADLWVESAQAWDAMNPDIPKFAKNRVKPAAG
jgi:hypothetical protein